MPSLREPTPVSPEEAREAAEAASALQKLRATRTARVRIDADGSEEVTVTVPAAALELFSELLSGMAKGHAMTLVPYHAELTTQQAADLLNVSRPYVIKLLDEEKLPHRRVGNRRKIRFVDVMDYKHTDDVERRRVADELTREAEDLGLAY